MTKENIVHSPIVFEPILKTVIWGGNKICKLKGIPQEIDNIGESWEISHIPNSESIVAEGVYKGLSLTQLIKKFGKQLLGNAVFEKYGEKFPLLVKFIDANDNLSIQVHPSDKIAKERHGGLGKTEMWYVLEANDGAKIYAGLTENLKPEDYETQIKNDSFMELVKSFDSKSGDVFFLPPGTVHAIGAGNLLAEIQQSSDITYRIYDYNRKDKNGKPRELHTSLAKDAINYDSQESCIKTDFSDTDGHEQLVECEHFTTYKVRVNGEKSIKGKKDSFTILIGIEGETEVTCRDGKITMTKGKCVLVPAYAESISLKGEGILLMTTVI